MPLFINCTFIALETAIILSTTNVEDILSMIFIFLILAGCEKKPAVIPKPLQMKSGSGEFDLKSSTPVYVEKGSEKSHMAASYLVHTINNATGIELTFEECDEL